MKFKEITKDLNKTTPEARRLGKKLVSEFAKQKKQNQITLAYNIDYIIEECNLNVTLTTDEKALLAFNMMHCFKQFKLLDDPATAWCNTNVIMMDVLFKFHVNGGKYDREIVKEFVAKVDELTSPVTGKQKRTIIIFIMLYASMGAGAMLALGVDPLLIGPLVVSYIFVMYMLLKRALLDRPVGRR